MAGKKFTKKAILIFYSFPKGNQTNKSMPRGLKVE
jgi:hypothetical protein